MFKVFVHSRYKRPATHIDAFIDGSSFAALEVGSLTVEIDRKPSKPTSQPLFRIGGTAFWLLFIASACSRIAGVVDEPHEHFALSGAWLTYVVAQTTIFRS